MKLLQRLVGYDKPSPERIAEIEEAMQPPEWKAYEQRMGFKGRRQTWEHFVKLEERISELEKRLSAL